MRSLLNVPARTHLFVFLLFFFRRFLPKVCATVKLLGTSNKLHDPVLKGSAGELINPLD